MYNSYVVGLLSKLWDKITFSYNYSFLKKIVDSLTRTLNKLSSGSVIVSLFNEKKLIIDKSYTYKLLEKILKSIEKVLEGLSTFYKKISKTSYISSTRKKVLEDIDSLIFNLALLFLGFSSTIILLNIANKSLGSNSMKVSVALFLLSVFIINREDSLVAYYDNSFIGQMINNILSVDEGGDQWW